MMRRLRLLLVAMPALLALAVPATSSAAGWTCESSALRATVLTAPAIEPVTANGGAGDCKAATSSLAPLPDVGPAILARGALSAETGLDGPPNSVTQQTAHAAAGLGELRIGSLPDLPIPLPLPDLAQYAHVQVAPEVDIDLRPALRALIGPRQIPAVDLVRVTAARSEARASCSGGVPRLSGSSTVSGVFVAGREIGLEQAVTRTVQLIDSQSIDPSDITSIPGLPASVPLPAVQHALDQLPTITVPATLARIRLTPGERVETGVRLTQRALHAEVSIAGRQLADVIVGEATVGSAGVSCGGVADLALQCTARRIVLIDVKIQRGRVLLYGAADRRFAGHRIRVRSSWDGRTVARPKLSRSGLFRATAALPPTPIRNTNHARYQASVGRERSLNLKLVRRMIVAGTVHRGARVIISGRVTQPLARPARTIEVTRRVTCASWRVVKRFRPRRDGHFRIRLPAPAEGDAAAYRMRTRVPKYTWLPKLYPTFTLPRYVDLA